ncbi:MAG: Iron-dependent repressor IdeR [Candidatus Heimdallarchaeota archaeon LC_3]|nr:MAG: Iron-dependent repressor IdeR [Candidatus Heimdallarchaeota archaeon LC_3]
MSLRSIHSTEDYLSIIWQLKNEYVKKNDSSEIKPVRIKDIAEKLDISSPSVSEYVRKLAKSNKLVVIDRKGVILTEEGEKEALIIINRHKIIYCFLTNILGIEKRPAHSQSHELEHVMELDTIGSLYQFIKKNVCLQFDCPFDKNCVSPSNFNHVSGMGS